MGDDDLERAGMSDEEWANLQAMIGAARGMRRVFDSYVLAGFSEPQAMQIVLAMLANALGNSS